MSSMKNPFRSIDVVADCHHLLKLRASSRGITIHEVFERNMPWIYGDERAIRQVVLNLLSNSIKFTPQGGEIWLKVGWTASGGQYLSVKDTGSGSQRTRFQSCWLHSARDPIRSNPQSKGPGSDCRSQRAWSTCTAALLR